MIARLRGRLAESGGYTLTEMLVVLAILGVVLAAFVQLFVSGSHAQVDLNNRFRAQQNARLALDKLRREIHCTSAAAKGPDGTPLAGATDSVRFTLPGWCPTNSTASSAAPATEYATWCTAPVSAGRYQLWRYVTTSAATFVSTSACGADVPGATKVLWADYLTQANAFPAYVAPQGGSSWASATAYTAGQLVRPTDTSANPYLFSVTTAGTSGASEPTWPTTLNATVANGTATFKNIGPLTFGLGQLSVELPVDLTPGDTMQRYTLKDDIVLRNTTR
jgi:prepilin-type N-terminal cleavage/methylation domain-containing protein